MAGQGGAADAHFTDAGKGGLEGGQQLTFQLAVDLCSAVRLRHVAADVGIEQQRIDELVAVLAEAADGDVQVDARPLVHHPEGDRRGGAVLVADDLLGVEVVDPLVLGSLAAESEPLADLLEHLADALAQIAGKDAGFGGGVEGKLARLGADLHHLALLHDHHALAVGHGNDGAAGDDVVAALGIAGAARGALLPLHRQNVRRDGLAVKILLPLVGQYATRAAQCCLNKSHK